MRLLRSIGRWLRRRIEGSWLEVRVPFTKRHVELLVWPALWRMPRPRFVPYPATWPKPLFWMWRCGPIEIATWSGQDNDQLTQELMLVPPWERPTETPVAQELRRRSTLH
jgi:hypothetical protein